MYPYIHIDIYIYIYTFARDIVGDILHHFATIGMSVCEDQVSFDCAMVLPGNKDCEFMSGWNLGPYKQWIHGSDWLDQKQPETVRSNETLKAQIIQKGQKLWKWAGCMMANARPSAVSTMELAFAVLALVVMGDAKDGLHELSHRNHRITWTFTVLEFNMDNSYQFIIFWCNFNCPFYIQQLSLLRYGKCAFGLSWLLGDQRGEQELAEDRWKAATM